MKTFKEQQMDIVAQRRIWNGGRRAAVSVCFAAQCAGGDSDKLQRVIDYLITPEGCTLIRIPAIWPWESTQ